MFSQEIFKGKNGKFGIMEKSGKVLIDGKYDFIGEFSNGFAKVELQGKWGIIEKTGSEIIPTMYDNVHLFSEGLAGVNVGAVDRKGGK